MLKLAYSNKFKKDYKKIKKRGYQIEKLEKLLHLLAEEKALPEKYSNHMLTGNFLGFNECHITPDWLLIYEIEDKTLFLYLTRTGTHSDLFR